MKKLLALVLASVMVLSLAGCAAQEAAPAETKAAQTEAAQEAAPAETKAAEAAQEAAPVEEVNAIQTVNPGKLTVATSPDFAPYEFYAIGDDGKPYLAGFDMDLAQYVANELGLELEVIPMDFDGTIMELSQGNVDMSLAGYSVTEERKEVMDFSIVYYGGAQSFVTTKANKDKFTDLASANNPDLTIEAQTGSIQADLMKQNTPDANCIEMVKVTDIIAELVSGKADGAFIEKAVAESYQANYPDLELLCDVPFDSEGSAAGITKGNTALVDGVNAAIEKCIASGEFDKFVQNAQELAKGDIIEGLLD